MGRAVAILTVVMITVAACAAPTAPQTPAAGTAVAQTAPPSAATTDGPSPSTSPSAPPSDPPIEVPATGTFLFTRYDEDGRGSIWVSCPDLGDAHRLPAPDGLDDSYGVWSPDGRRIVFNAGHDNASANDGGDRWDIYTMKRDGTDAVTLTDATGLNGDPVYSPDGQLVAYDSTEAGREGIWLMDADDGGHKRLVARLPDGADRDYAPTFSHDGQHLVFVREVETDVEASLWIVKLDGTELHRLATPGLYPSVSEWSPDGTRIVFEAAPTGQDLATLWLIDADGGNLTELTPLPPDSVGREGFSKPTWSDDGTLIYMIHGLHPGPTRLGIAAIRPDGTGLRYVSDGTGYEHQPDWTDAPC